MIIMCLSEKEKVYFEKEHILEKEAAKLVVHFAENPTRSIMPQFEMAIQKGIDIENERV